LIEKYIPLGNIMDWVCNESKLVQRVSNQWKEMSLSFLVLKSILAWKVGLGHEVRVVMDEMMGATRDISFPKSMDHSLHQQRKVTLEKLVYPTSTSIW
jgi:hypothetical protein